jgi:hypothetical protein
LIDAVKITRGKLARAAALVDALSACSAQPQSNPAVAAAAPPNIQSSEQCSSVGVMACNAMALLSRDSAPTCAAYRASDGTRIETCGSFDSGTRMTGLAPSNPQVYPVHLAWSDNADNESNFVIERCDEVSTAPQGEKTSASCKGAWKTVGTVGANVTSYVDNTAARNQTYIYRVRATNSKGSSGYLDEAVITTPSR